MNFCAWMMRSLGATHFFVLDGGVSVVTGEFKSASPQFTVWAYERPADVLNELPSGSRIVVSSGSLGRLGYEGFSALESSSRYTPLVCTSSRYQFPGNEVHCSFRVL